jgi:hypothetical protein
VARRSAALIAPTSVIGAGALPSLTPRELGRGGSSRSISSTNVLHA